MMTKTVMGALIAGVMGGTPALADTLSDSIVGQLKAQGFKNVSTERTWLGRTRIVASGSEGEREIIVNPNTGEILRDLWLTNRGDGSAGLLRDTSTRIVSRNDDNDNDNDNDNGGKSGGDSNGGKSGGGRDSDRSGGGNGGDSD